MAVVSSRSMRLQQLADRGNAEAAAALSIAASPGAFLSTVQVGITVIGVFMGAFREATLSAKLAGSLRGVPALARHAEPLAIAIVVIGIIHFPLILGELVPKRAHASCSRSGSRASCIADALAPA